jgi:hypothetical protein
MAAWREGQLSLDLLSSLMPVPKRIRLLGITLSTLSAEAADGGSQLPLPL